jgi:hypothetical protein
MEKVIKVCLQLSAAEIFLSLFPHSKGTCYRMNEKSVPQVGFLYGFLNGEDAVKWIRDSIKGDVFGPVIQQIKAHGARLCLLQGDSTRVACKFSAAVRHIQPAQLTIPDYASTFWASGTGEISKQLIVLPDPDGSVLVPDFTPRLVSMVVE